MLKLFSKPWDEVPYVFIDTETTGVNPGRDRAVQVGLARFEKGRLAGSAVQLVDPGMLIPEDASAVHGITSEMVRGLPAIQTFFVSPKAARLLDDAQPAAYNAPFDKLFVPPFGEDWTWPWADVLSMVRSLDRFVKGKGRHTLEASCVRHGVKLSKAHDAEADAVATGELFFKIASKIGALVDATLGDLLCQQRHAEADQWYDFNEWRSKQESSNI